MKTLIMLMIMASQSVAPNYFLKSAYWTSPVMSLREADSLAKNDLVIADFENASNNYASLRRLKNLNPNLKLIAYTNPTELFTGPTNHRPRQTAWVNYLHKNHPNWFLKTAKGKPAVFWPGMQMMNESTECPRDKKGENYDDWLVDSLKVILRDTIWNGYFRDNGGGHIAWLYQGKGDQIDANNDGRPDNPEHLDKVWTEGIHSFLKKLRAALGPNFLLLANKGSVEFMDVLDGRFYESFPCPWLGDKKNNGWDQCLINAKQTGKYTIFQAGVRSLSPGFINFTAASAALLGVSVAIGQDNTQSYPFYHWNLGKPKDGYKKKGEIYYREFKNGRIEVNPKLQKGEWIPMAPKVKAKSKK